MTLEVAQGILFSAAVYGLAVCTFCLLTAAGVAAIRIAWKGDSK